MRGVENNLVVATAEAAQDIKTAIGAAIGRRIDHPVDIDVVFDDGTVTLRGTVHSSSERRDAEESARLALGVRDVIDDDLGWVQIRLPGRIRFRDRIVQIAVRRP